MELETKAQWLMQPTQRHLLFSAGFWRNMMLVQFDLINAGVLPMGTALLRLLDFWVRNRLPPRSLGLLPREVEAAATTAASAEGLVRADEEHAEDEEEKLV